MFSNYNSSQSVYSSSIFNGENTLLNSSLRVDGGDSDTCYDPFPPGYRFQPTDEELILDYLTSKLCGNSLPSNRIKEVDFYKYSPQELAARHKGHDDKELYFFSSRMRKYKNRKRPSRRVDDGSGYWKATAAPRPIQSFDSEIMIGTKTPLTFFKGDPPKGTKTNWIAYEYMVQTNPTESSKSIKDNNGMLLDFCVLYKLYQSSKKGYLEDNASSSNNTNHDDQFTTSTGILKKRKTSSMPNDDNGNDFRTLNQEHCHHVFVPQYEDPPMHGPHQNLNNLMGFSNNLHGITPQASSTSQPMEIPSHSFRSQNHANPYRHKQIPSNGTQHVMQEVNMMQQSLPLLPQPPPMAVSSPNETYSSLNFQEGFCHPTLDLSSYQVDDNILIELINSRGSAVPKSSTWQPMEIPSYSFPSQNHASPNLHKQIPSNASQLVMQEVNMLQQSLPLLPQSPPIGVSLPNETHSSVHFQESFCHPTLDLSSYQVNDNVLIELINNSRGSTLQESSTSQPIGVPCRNQDGPYLHQQDSSNATTQLGMHEVETVQQLSSVLPQSPLEENALPDETYSMHDFQEDLCFSMLEEASYQAEDNSSMDPNEYFDASFLFEDSQDLWSIDAA